MRLIIWYHNRNNLFVAPIIALLTLFVAHICCIGPLLIIPLGLKSSNNFFGNIKSIQLVFNIIAVSLLTYNGWRLYRRPTPKLARIGFWVSCLIVLYMITNY